MKYEIKDRKVWLYQGKKQVCSMSLKEGQAFCLGLLNEIDKYKPTKNTKKLKISKMDNKMVAKIKRVYNAKLEKSQGRIPIILIMEKFPKAMEKKVKASIVRMMKKGEIYKPDEKHIAKI